jgi:lipid-binding SYLF domain-containing protein
MTRIARTLILTVVVGLVGSGSVWAKTAEEIDAEANQALDTLYSESSAAKELGAKARGILVFPSITKGGVIVGGEYGEGVLRVDGKSQGYYSSASGSLGLQLGISSRSLVIMFMTGDALKEFTSASGWEAWRRGPHGRRERGRNEGYEIGSLVGSTQPRLISRC